VSGPWNFEDVWFLEAVRWATFGPEGASLRDVIIGGDMINHAIFHPDEIERAVNRLTAAGLLSVRSDRFLLTPEAQGIVAQAPSGSQLERLEWLRGALPTASHEQSEVWRLDKRDWRYATTPVIGRLLSAVTKPFTRKRTTGWHRR